MSSADAISVRIQHSFLENTGGLQVEFDLPAAGIVGVFGPSGSGKTTLLRILAGLLKADQADIQFQGRVWQDQHTFIPAHQRRIGYVFQEASLFPHLSVFGNIEYGQKRTSQARIDIQSLLQLLEIEELMTRSVEALSGGEQQRVALARALAAGPELLLLDEPLSALDHQLKQEILPFLARLKDESDIPMVYVSHSADEIALLADHLLVVDQGKLIASGKVEQTYPALGGLDKVHLAVLIEATVANLDEQWHLATCQFPGGELQIRSPLGAQLGSKVRIRVQARDVSLNLAPGSTSSILNHLPAEITSIKDLDDEAMVLVTTTVSGESGETQFFAQITRRSANELKIEIGSTVYLQIKSAAILG